jgi:hypothetical protein
MGLLQVPVCLLNCWEIPLPSVIIRWEQCSISMTKRSRGIWLITLNVKVFLPTWTFVRSFLCWEIFHEISGDHVSQCVEHTFSESLSTAKKHVHECVWEYRYMVVWPTSLHGMQDTYIAYVTVLLHPERSNEGKICAIYALTLGG